MRGARVAEDTGCSIKTVLQPVLFDFDVVFWYHAAIRHGMITDQTLQRIKQYALKTDWDDAFDGASRGNRHLERIVRIAEHLAVAEYADVSVVMAGSLLHDMALPAGNEYDYESSKAYARKELRQFNLAPREMDAIAECIASHEGVAPPKTLEAKMVHDADVLDKSGILGLIRHTWKLVHLGTISSGTISDGDVRNICNHIAWRGSKLYSSVAKQLRAVVSVETSDARAKDIIQAAARMAGQGFITETIAQKLMHVLNKNQRECLASQLDLSYLSKAA